MIPSPTIPSPTGGHGNDRDHQPAVSAPSLPMHRTIADVSGIFGVCERTVRQWIRDQRIPVIHIGGVYRFHEADLVQFILQHRIEAKGFNAIKPEAWEQLERIIEAAVHRQLKGVAA